MKRAASDPINSGTMSPKEASAGPPSKPATNGFSLNSSEARAQDTECFLTAARAGRIMGSMKKIARFGPYDGSGKPPETKDDDRESEDTEANQKQ